MSTSTAKGMETPKNGSGDRSAARDAASTSHASTETVLRRKEVWGIVVGNGLNPWIVSKRLCSKDISPVGRRQLDATPARRESGWDGTESRVSRSKAHNRYSVDFPEAAAGPSRAARCPGWTPTHMLRNPDRVPAPDGFPMARRTKRTRRSASLLVLLQEVRACRHCEDKLPLEPRPVLRAHQSASVLIAGQAPGLRVHETGIPWNDPSGDRLRAWLGLDRETFYDERQFAIIPMGYCYPGRGTSGDLPPRRECAELWLNRLLAELPALQLTLLVGQYAQRHYLGDRVRENLTETVRAWKDFLPQYFPLPHPSPRNQLWLRRNAWFSRQVVPALRKRCQLALRGSHA